MRADAIGLSNAARKRVSFGTELDGFATPFLPEKDAICGAFSKTGWLARGCSDGWYGICFSDAVPPVARKCECRHARSKKLARQESGSLSDRFAADADAAPAA